MMNEFGPESGAKGNYCKTGVIVDEGRGESTKLSEERGEKQNNFSLFRVFNKKRWNKNIFRTYAHPTNLLAKMKKEDRNGLFARQYLALLLLLLADDAHAELDTLDSRYSRHDHLKKRTVRR
jgi:hypothetical protein